MRKDSNVRVIIALSLENKVTTTRTTPTTYQNGNGRRISNFLLNFYFMSTHSRDINNKQKAFLWIKFTMPRKTRLLIEP